MTATPIYTSSSRLYVEQTGPKILSDAGGVQRQSDSYLYTQAQLLTSTPIVSSAVESLGATNLREFKSVDNLIGQLKSAVRVEVGKKDELLTVSFDSAYPEDAAKTVNAIVDAYINYHSSQKRSTASEVLKILTKEKEKRDIELAEKTKAVLDFKQANAALSFESDRGNVLIQRVVRLSDALTDAQLKAADAKATLNAATALADNPGKLRELIDADRASKSFSSISRDEQLRNQLTQMMVQQSLLRQTYGPGHRSVRQIDTVIADLRASIAASDTGFAEAYLASAKQSHEVSLSKEMEIQSALESAQKDAMELNTKAAVYSRLDTEVKRVEKICDILDSRIKELNVSEDVGALNISVLEVARPEKTPTQPRKTRSMALSMVLGLMSGIGLALVRDWTDHRIRSADEVQAMLGVPVLGVIPHMEGKNTARERGRLVADDPVSGIAEAYRTVRTTLYFGIGSNPRTILVTSPESGDGKTTLVSNLAITMAQSGQKVLLLDCDLRKPSQAELFGVDKKLGFSKLLSPGFDALSAIIATNVAGLDLLAGGSVPANPAEILSSPAFTTLLTELAGKYDRIVIDSPPVMTVTDARILGSLCDNTVMVLRAEKSTRRGARDAMEALRSVGAQVIGVVVNDVSRRSGQYGYGYGYGAGYGYGQRYGVYGSAHADGDRQLVGAAGTDKSA